MGKVSVKVREYKGWPNCVEVSNGIVELIATTDVGPRIIHFGFVGGVNEFCEVAEQIGTTGGDEWKIYGGHRLWHSPEASPRTYQPDNSKIDWQEIQNGIILSQPTEKLTMIKKEMQITMSPDKAGVTVLHRLTNEGLWPVELAVWAISVMAAGGKEIIPQVTVDTGLLPNRSVLLWPYSKMNDNRVYWGDKFITLQQDINASGPFKLGIPNQNGWAAYANNNHLFVLRNEYSYDKAYPDFGASYESYTNNFMVEMETLSPLVLLKTGDSAEHIEEWSLYDNVKVPQNEKEIEEFILPLIK